MRVRITTSHPAKQIFVGEAGQIFFDKAVSIFSISDEINKKESDICIHLGQFSTVEKVGNNALSVKIWRNSEEGK